MEDRHLHLPRDFESRTPFRLLENQVGRLTALAWMLLLWRDLAYAAESNALGTLSAEAIELLNSALRGVHPTLAESEKPHEILGRCDGLLTAVEGGAWYCALFVGPNRHLSADHVSMQKVGGKKRGVEARARQIEAEAAQQAVLIDEKLFERPDGTRMDRDESRRTVMLVRMLDHYLGKPSRLQSAFSRGLVNDAYSVLKRYDQEAIYRFCTWLAIQRESGRVHPAVPTTAEEILRDFDQFATVKLG